MRGRAFRDLPWRRGTSCLAVIHCKSEQLSPSYWSGKRPLSAYLFLPPNHTSGVSIFSPSQTIEDIPKPGMSSLNDCGKKPGLFVTDATSSLRMYNYYHQILRGIFHRPVVQIRLFCLQSGLVPSNYVTDQMSTVSVGLQPASLHVMSCVHVLMKTISCRRHSMVALSIE